MRRPCNRERGGVFASRTCIRGAVPRSRRRRDRGSYVERGSGWGPVALADFKSVMPRDERGRWVRLPRTPASKSGVKGLAWQTTAPAMYSLDIDK